MESSETLIHENWVAAAIWCQSVAIAYLEIVEWVPLGNWNNIKNGNGQASLDIVMGLVLAMTVVFYLKRWRWAMLAGPTLYGFWFCLQITTWWLPYLRGATPQWAAIYSRWFASTYKFLPAIGNHPVPDAEHTVLTAILIAALVASVGACREQFRSYPTTE